MSHEAVVLLAAGRRSRRFLHLLVGQALREKDLRRVRESTLLWLCAVGGAAGGLLSMRLFHHKTRKKPFAIGVPLMLAAQAGLLAFLTWKCLT